jgi:hypothetical protein
VLLRDIMIDYYNKNKIDLIYFYNRMNLLLYSLTL